MLYVDESTVLRTKIILHVNDNKLDYIMQSFALLFFLSPTQDKIMGILTKINNIIALVKRVIICLGTAI